jgi:hypothetical protein
MEQSGHHMTLHKVVRVMVDVVLYLHLRSHSTGGAESTHVKKSPPSSVCSSSTSITNGVEEDAIFFASCFSKSAAIWLLLSMINSTIIIDNTYISYWSIA